MQCAILSVGGVDGSVVCEPRTGQLSGASARATQPLTLLSIGVSLVLY
jgi:hypothetical protein